MKSTEVRRLVVVALATALILLNYSAFAQTPTPQKGASSHRAAGEAGEVATAKEPERKPRDFTEPARIAPKPVAAAIIGLVPADILTSCVEAETGFSLRTVSPSTTIGSPEQLVAEDTFSLAKKLRNPVSALARISFESNLDFGLAADREGYRYTMNLEPLIPFALNKDWNLISRTRFPLVQQDGIVESTVQTGLGDILQSFFLSPNSTEPIFWGAGTTLLIPTATDTRLGTGKFGIGPALVVGKQHRDWTYGAQARHIWSVAGHSDRADVRSTYLQPFVSYTTRSAWTYSLDTESTYDWVAERWSVPIHFEVSKVIKIGRHAVSVGGAVTCWAVTFAGGPQACGVRFNVTPLFPAK